MKTILNRVTGDVSGRDRGPRWGLAIPAAILMAVLLWAPSSYADLSFSISPVSTTETSSAFTGNFEIDVTNTGASNTNVNSFSLDVQLSPSLGINLTNATTSTTLDTYIFNGIGLVEASGGLVPFYTPISSSEFIAGDSDFSGSTPPGGTLPAVVVSPGASYGLAYVSFSASSASAGTAFINFLTSGTAYTDTSGTTTYTLGSGLDYPTPGTITVSTAVVIPEPSTLVFLASGLGTVLVAGGLSRRRFLNALGRQDQASAPAAARPSGEAGASA